MTATSNVPITPSQSRERVFDALSAVLPVSVEVRPERTSGRGVVIAGRKVIAEWAGQGSLGDVRGVLTPGKLPESATLQVIERPDRAGQGMLTVGTEDLRTVVAELEQRNLAPQPIDDTAARVGILR